MVFIKRARTGGYHALKPYPFVDKLTILLENVMPIATQKYIVTQKEATTYHKIP